MLLSEQHEIVEQAKEVVFYNILVFMHDKLFYLLIFFSFFNIHKIIKTNFYVPNLIHILRPLDTQ